MEQAITLLRQTRSPTKLGETDTPSYNETFALLWLGVTRYFQDRSAEGQQIAQTCLTQFAARGDRWGEGWSLLLWGNCLRDGRPAEAAQVYQHGLFICQANGDQSVLSYCYGNFCQVARELGEYDQAQH